MKERKLKGKVREKFEAAGPLQDGKFGREKNKETLESRRIVLQLFEGSYPLRQWFPLGTTIELFLNGVVKKVVRRSQITLPKDLKVEFSQSLWRVKRKLRRGVHQKT